MPSFVLATLCLNEMEWLPKLYEQHKSWPGLKGWVFVESADVTYAATNPTLVSPQGLSVDGTTEFLEELAKKDSRIHHVKFGFCSHPTDPAQAKVMARQKYLDVAEDIKPDFIFVVDADEFYPHSAQGKIASLLTGAEERSLGFCFKQRDIWRPASIQHEPLFKCEVVGGYWDVRHCRGWRWRKGMHYRRNHNWPEIDDIRFSMRMVSYCRQVGAPECVHLGFASQASLRAAKNNYYIARGEGVTDHRRMYVVCRRAFEEWKPGDRMPYNSRVIPYMGLIPECFNGDMP